MQVPESSKESALDSTKTSARRAYRLHLLDERLRRAEKAQRSHEERAVALQFYSMRERQAIDHLLRLCGVKKGFSLTQDACESPSTMSADERLSMMEDHMTLIEKHLTEVQAQFDTNRTRIEGIIASMMEKCMEIPHRYGSDIEDSELIESLLMQSVRRVNEQQEAIVHFDAQQYAFEEELANEFQRLFSLFKLFESTGMGGDHSEGQDG